MTLEQYESAEKLLELLDAIGIPSAKEVLNNFIENNADDWVMCDGCAELRSDCICQPDWRYAAEYDDEASY